MPNDLWARADTNNNGSPHWLRYFEDIIHLNYNYFELCQIFLQCEVQGLMEVNYNDIGYFSWYGNIAHYLVLAIAENDSPEYIIFLDSLVEIRSVNVNQVDYYGCCPLEVYSKLSKTQKWNLGLELILKHSGQLERMQACVRGFLVRRRIRRNMWSMCVDEILMG